MFLYWVKIKSNAVLLTVTCTLCVCVCGFCRETLRQHFLTTCDFLLRRFSFQKKILPHIYQQRRLQVSKKDFFFLFPKINHVFLQTYRQCNSLEIQKNIHYQSYLCTQGPASCSNCNTCDCVQRFSGLVNVCLSRIPQRWIMGREGMAGGHKGIKAALSRSLYEFLWGL